MGSSDYAGLVAKCNQIIKDVSALYSYIESCSNNINKFKPLIAETIIDNETIDKGTIDNVGTVLSHLRSVFDTVIAECTLKREIYEALRLVALRNEKEQNKGQVV